MGEEQRLSPDEQLAAAREAFESGTDFTVAVEEEFALLDPDTLELVNRYEELKAAAKGSELDEHLVGELIASEAEIRTGRCSDFAEAAARMVERRAQLHALAREQGRQLGGTGTYPTVELRIMDGQPELGEAQSLAALGYALAARCARALDEGEPLPDVPRRLLEENMWRAIRHGLSGELVDFERGETLPARARLEQLVDWVAPVADEIGVGAYLSIPAQNAAERQRARYEEGATLAEIYAEQVGAGERIG